MRIDDATFDGLRRGCDAAWRAFAVAVDRAFRHKTELALPASEVDDLLQEVFLRVFGHIGEVESPRHLSNLTSAVWHQRMVDWFRKRGRSRETPAGTLEDVLALADPAASDGCAEPDPERAAAASELVEAVVTSRSLRLEQKLLVELHLLDGLTIPECARALGMETTNAETLFGRARKALRKEMALRCYRESPERFQAELSAQEREALDLLASGTAERDVARSLGLRVRELAARLSDAIDKLARAAAEDWWRLLGPPPPS